MIAGNYQDKYNSKNPISRFLVNGFLSSFQSLLPPVSHINTLAEYGAGEGYLSNILCHKYPQAQKHFSDIDSPTIKLAQKNLTCKEARFSVQDIQNPKAAANSFDLLVCCEVLEHVKNPQVALSQIYRLTKTYALLSVPHEPIWRLLNIARGHYLANFGNTPGHLNHWSSLGFLRFISANSKFKINKVAHPFPWTMVLLTK